MTKININILLILGIIFFTSYSTTAQFGNVEIDYTSPKKYTIGGIVVDGVPNLDHNRIIAKSGLKRGQEIVVPGDDVSQAIKKLWDENYFSDVQILAEKISGSTIFLVIKLTERERLSRFKFNGISKSEADDIREQLNLYSGMIVTEDLRNRIKSTTRNFFIDKGFYHAKVQIVGKPDTVANNSVMMKIMVNKGERIKINSISIEGNEKLTDAQIKKAMKDTKEKHWYRIFWRSKFIQSSFKSDKQKVIDKYKDLAYRDASIVFDTVYDHDSKTLDIKMKVDEGNQYFIRSISWVGNLKYSSGKLDTVLGIKPGDLYNKGTLDTRLYMNPGGTDVSSLYMDDGYLFFQVTPIEKRVTNDSVDLEFRIYEGKQARIKNITVTGNTKTSDHVIIRDLYTKPGDLFSRDAVIRSQRQLSQNGYFDPEKLNVNPKPNPNDGTVDIEYIVAERPSDQIELSGGWGAGRVVGTLGVSFNNFSARKMFKKGAWTPLPAGDGQKLSLRAQSNGYYYQSYNFSFTEPWLGGKKPNSFSVSAYHSVQAYSPKFYTDSVDANGDKVRNLDRQVLKITGLSIGLGRRLKWPDDYFTVYHELGYQYYDINNFGNVFSFATGYVNNIYYQWALSRSSIDQPLYPRTGSSFKVSIKTTLPYSWFKPDGYFVDKTDQEKYKLIEYNKIKFTSSWFSPLSKDKKLVLNARLGFGWLNGWNKDLGAPPFERFYLGGSGLTGYSLAAQEIIALRGYDDKSISPTTGSSLISKYTLELRYPLSLNPSATIYMLGFAEAGNTWNSYKDYNPFQVKRSAGVGVRIFLPMFGLMGLDYGFGFDPLDNGASGQAAHNADIISKGYHGQFHFTIGMNLGEL